jgi:hypothetical protein
LLTIYKGAIEQLYTQPPDGSVVVCLDEMGPTSAKRFPGHALVDVSKCSAKRARQEIDYGRRGAGYVFGAFQPLTGEALTWTAERRTTANFVAFLEQTDPWLDPGVQRIYTILDHLSGVIPVWWTVND